MNGAKFSCNRRNHDFRMLTAALVGVWLIWITGCVSSEKPKSSLTLEDPRISQGLLTQDAQEDGLDQLALALENSATGSKRQSAGTPPHAPSLPLAPIEVEAIAGDSTPTAADLPEQSADPFQAAGGVPGFGKLISLPKLSPVEINELLSAIQLTLESELGYRPARAADVSALARIPSGLSPGPALSKPTAEGPAILRMGHRRFLSQPAQLWIEGAIVTGTNHTPGKNPDLDALPALIERLFASSEARKKTVGHADLERRLIRLSYIDVPGAMSALKGFGVRIADDLGALAAVKTFEELPLVAAMPSPDTNQVALLGREKTEKGPFELSLTPSVATPLPGVVNTAPSSQLVVLFHPAHPAQFDQVKRLLEDFIDRPERQIFVEGMVLEISEEGLKELGLEWEFREGNFEWVAGALATGGIAPATAMLNFNNIKNNFDQNWVVRLKALVREKKAEVLSRPSVLTVNNRQATIRVGTDIPIATSQQEAGNVVIPGSIAFNFKYIATGISLNVMPRANEAGTQVSLLIDTIVSAQVPDADLELRSATGTVLAHAPTMATRRIQTYARIDNNTPFIIGGLVHKEYSTTRDKIPLLGNIPYLGALFRSKRTSSSKREVIIVLTPHILEPELGKAFGRFLPKDEDQFDEFGNRLFRDTYRIRSEDVFDLTFITDNPRLQQARQTAQRALSHDFRLAYVEPFSQFADHRFPGEDILVRRMVWEVVRRLSTKKGNIDHAWLDGHINPERLIVFESQQVTGGFSVQFFERVLSQITGAKDFDSFFTNNAGNALVMTFHGRPRDAALTNSIAVPIPEFRLAECPDHQQAWNKLLWDLNQPDERGVPRHSIVLRDRSDLVRLQRALIVKKIVALNGGNSRMSLSHFSLGKLLLMPEPKTDQFHPVDGEVAQYFFEIEKYYEATLRVIEQALQDIEAASRELQLDAVR